MRQKRVIGCWTLCAVSLFYVSGADAFFGDRALAQIIPDATLPVNSIVTQNGNTSKIDGGTSLGGNLFHSFEEFSVLTGGTAIFNNALDIQNVFARVTGRSISNIDGIIRANGAANLFLLNPNGIIFGANARIDIGGSFLASTASNLLFADGKEFSATAPLNTPLLTVSVPVGLQFGGSQQSIEVQGASLEVKPSQTLALVGGNVNINGGTLLSPGGRVELGGLAEAGTIGLNIDGSNLSLSFGDRIARANIFLDNNAEVNVRDGGGGNIIVHAGNLNLEGGSKLRAGMASGLGSVDSQAGDIEIDVTGEIALSDPGSFIANALLANSKGKGGDINITTDSLLVSNGGQIYTGTFSSFGVGRGDVGDVNINARSRVSFDFDGVQSGGVSSGAYSRVERGAIGQGGNVNITAGSLSLTRGAVVQANTEGQGGAGNLNINVRDVASFDGVGRGPDFVSSGAYSGVEFNDAVGNGGNINITAGSLSVTNGAVVTASTQGTGNAGNITINVSNAIVLSGISPFFNEILQTEQSSGIYSVVKPTGVGNAGNINITTGSLEVTNGALVIVRTRGQGNAGNIEINASDRVTISGIGKDKTSSALLTPTELGASGRGGDITVTTNVFRVSNGAVINAQTLNNSDAGNIIINANIFEATGGGQAIATTSSSGRAGNLTVNVTDKIILSGIDPNFAEREGRFDANIVGNNEGPASGLYANTGLNSTGTGGNLTVQGGELFVRDGAQVTVSDRGSGAAGNLEVAANSIHLDNGSLTATTTAGNFGNINLRSQGLVLRNRSIISTDATRGTANGGNITIDAGVLAVLEGSGIIAEAIEGRGGNILINTQGNFRSLDSEISASSQLGIDGVVDIQTPDIDPTQGLLNLPQEPIASQPPAQGCLARGEESSVRFINVGRGGMPPNPGDALSSNMGWVDLSSEVSNGYDEKLYSRSPDRIVEAQGWIINANGVVELTASAPIVTPNNFGSALPGCN